MRIILLVATLLACGGSDQAKTHLGWCVGLDCVATTPSGECGRYETFKFICEIPSWPPEEP